MLSLTAAPYILKKRRARDIRPVTPAQFRHYVHAYYGVTIPWKSVCDGHDAPFDYMVGSCLREEDMVHWTKAERDQYRLHQDCVVHANRGGGKTQNGGIAAHHNAVHWPRYGVTILGGSFKQSDRMHDVMGAADRGEFKDLVWGKLSVTKTRYRNGSHIEALPASPTSVRSPHTPSLVRDEVDEIDEEIYGDSHGIAMAMGGYESRREDLSTSHRPGGLMERVIKGAEQIGRPVYRWCVWEVCQRCPYPCSPKNPYKKCREMVKYDQLNLPHRFSDVCGGRAKRADGYYSLLDIWTNFEEPLMSWERFACEWLCEMPKLENARFPMLSNIHMANDWDGWREAGWDVIAGVDGGSSNFAAVWAAVGRLYDDIDEFDTVLVLANIATGRLTAGSDFADMFIAEHERMGLPPLAALFTSGWAVPDLNFKAEMDKPYRRSRIMRRTERMPEGKTVTTVRRENQKAGYEHMETLLALRNDPDGKSRPGMFFRKAARATFDAAYADEKTRPAADEPHYLAALRYLSRGQYWDQRTFESVGKKRVVAKSG
jgi:hypothetical protein